ncbi:AMP-binding protein [Candidatus Bandiella euplotis]|uniref:Non-ribosomal peptide synthesis amino acid adenylation domain protein n=1 Tax=Candidatus Bandiella euplotis TaxID=1664265 RepID=A0ABZ0ULK7_9RICK|nr:AMP-binding protein [Candidatus Bandiella woodruffii]WPX96577.1 Putative non-ribosomal peptide synthesis amino acid adenylation domain protein [Candidatus Bandiella woodruffii]
MTTLSNVVLTNKIYKQDIQSIIDTTFANKMVSILAIDHNETLEKLREQPHANPRNIGLRANLAYVIYTSGTTGNPKGVMIDHSAYITTIKYGSVER